jgi:hypothetical protein
MAVINLTPHAVQVYAEGQFINLEQVNPTTWVADGVEGVPLAEYPSHGVARISTKTTPVESWDKDLHKTGCLFVKTEYGEATGIPEDLDYSETLIVSLPMQSMAKAAGLGTAHLMVSPYKVVRSRENGSLVLGCMGFTQ